MDIFSLLLPKYKIDKNKKIRLISLFSGYDSQKLAFNYIDVDVEHYRAIEFDKYAIQSLNEIHNTNFETKDITKVSADELGIVDTKDYTYILTYSFPCTDLSLAGKRAGMDRESGTRSGLLWEVERLLKETKEKPQILIMENVPQVLSAKGWREWNTFLENLGYSNYTQILNAKDYGIPQNRERCFMVSILGEYSYEFPKPFKLRDRLKDLLENNVDEKYYLSEKLLKCFMSNGTGKYPRKERFLSNINRPNQDVANSITTLAGNRATDNFIIKNGNKALQETLELNDVEEFSYIDAYNRSVKNDGIFGTLTTRTIPSNNTFIVVPKVNIEEKKLKQQLCDDLIENGVVKENLDNKQYLGTYQFAKSEQFMNGKDRFEPNKEIIDCILTSQKVGVVENQNMKTKLCNDLIENGVVKENYVINHSYTNGLTGKNPNSRQTLDDYIETTDNSSPCLTTRPDTLGVVVKNENFNYQLSDLRIRKLTPNECFKLMGVKPRDYEKITCSNAQKYKQAGNSIVTTVLMAIYSQLFENIDYKYYIEELLKELRTN